MNGLNWLMYASKLNKSTKALSSLLEYLVCLMFNWNFKSSQWVINFYVIKAMKFKRYLLNSITSIAFILKVHFHNFYNIPSLSALVITRFQEEYGQYLLSFSYPDLFYEPSGEWNNSKMWETRKIMARFCELNVR